MSESLESKKRGKMAWQAMLFVVVVMLLSAAVVWLRWQDRRLATVTITIGEQTSVEAMVAYTPMRRSRGLSVRDSLGENEGMYFVFPELGQPLFWMKDMKFPIDILWISGGELVDMTLNVPVPSSSNNLPQYAPRVMVDRVLEVPAGFAQRHGLRLGLKVTPLLDTVSGVR